MFLIFNRIHALQYERTDIHTKRNKETKKQKETKGNKKKRKKTKGKQTENKHRIY